MVTLTEVMAGLRPGEEERTERLFQLFAIQDVNELIGRQASLYLRQFRRSHGLELGNALIAATALHHGAEVITRNLKHYPMTDISVVAPYERGRRQPTAVAQVTEARKWLDQLDEDLHQELDACGLHPATCGSTYGRSTTWATPEAATATGRR